MAAEVWAKAAGAHRTDGDGRAASRCSTHVDRLIAACDGARSPAFRLAGEVGQLTGREREIAERVAAGATNQEIADDLVVSVRTVESHLARVYRKLGVKRGDLAEALGP